MAQIAHQKQFQSGSYNNMAHYWYPSVKTEKYSVAKTQLPNESILATAINFVVVQHLACEVMQNVGC